MLEDVQSRPDDRLIPIDEVGIMGIRYPVAVFDRERGKQDTIADVSMSVDLRPEVKGAHLSRFVEVLHDSAGDITPQALPAVLQALRQRLQAERARVEFCFSYFLRRAAPVTGAAALMDYRCTLSGELNRTGVQVVLGARVPVTSVCPCSKAISDYGAHNQRAHITIHAALCGGDDGQPADVWVEDLIEAAEAAASSPVFPLLKRPDERHVTMHAHDQPVFVEDMVRSTAQALKRDKRINWFRVEAASDESIHNHGAFARLQSSSCSCVVPAHLGEP
jgi:GTP cyclohydrolase IB